MNLTTTINNSGAEMLELKNTNLKGQKIVTNNETVSDFIDLVIDIIIENGEKISLSFLRQRISEETRGRRKFRGFSYFGLANFEELGFDVTMDAKATYVDLTHEEDFTGFNSFLEKNLIA